MSYLDKHITEMAMEIIDVCDFDLDYNQEDDTFSLIDRQGAYLSGEESYHEFSSLRDVIDRLDAFIEDTIYRSIEEREISGEITFDDDWDLKARDFLEDDRVAELLGSESVNQYIKEKFIEKFNQEKIRQERINLLLDALVVGACDFKVRHGQAAPHDYKYYVASPILKGFCAPVTSDECGEWFNELPENLYKYLVDELKWNNTDFTNLKENVEKAWKELPNSYKANLHEPDPTRYLHRNYIANGYEDDGFYNIVAGKCTGDWSSMTTNSQNDLSQQLIVLKGFCPDVYFSNHRTYGDYWNSSFKECVEQVYERHGIDNDISDLDAWAERNNTRCGANKECFVDKNDLKNDKQREPYDPGLNAKDVSQSQGVRDTEKGKDVR